MIDPTQRFSDRVADYVAYRPSYPAGVLDVLTRECSLSPHWRVADLGSGPGALTRLFLHYGCRVWGVEPNSPMRKAGEDLLRDYPSFTSVDGRAEKTTLGTESVDLVVAGQAFHWFDREATRDECRRILTAPRWAALVWNDRRLASTPFLVAYEALLELYGTDYATVNNKATVGAAALTTFFGPRGYASATLDNAQRLDFPALRGRLLSSSYIPRQGQSGYDAMLRDLRTIFDAHQTDGVVSFDYDTRIFYGRL